MDRRERTQDGVEATLASLDYLQSQIWTALPGIVDSFDHKAMTVSVQPAVKGRVADEQGNSQEVDLPLLVDVPVVFPHGGAFVLTYPIRQGDECLVVFASRCIDAWWQAGGVGTRLDQRMHDLSDGFAIVGPRSQPNVIDPPVDTANVQLRTDDGQANITIQPDYTIIARNPAVTVTLTPGGELLAVADSLIRLQAPAVQIDGNITITGNITQSGSHTSSGDQVAGGISQTGHTHPGDSGGTTGGPQ